MRTRDLLRFVPGLSRLVRTLDARERESQLLTEEFWRLANENHRLKRTAPNEPRRKQREARESLQLPPDVLRLMVAGTEDSDWFLAAGALAADSLRELLTANNVRLEECERILDFGCGCGRVIRHLRELPAELHGCDTNPVAVEWCHEYLPFGHFAVNALESPLQYDSASFDLIYAFSVFTHLPFDLQVQWICELRRVLKPGGMLVLSLHGNAMLRKLSRAERADYHAGRLVVRIGELAGTNHCAAFHPAAYVRETLASGFEVLEMRPEGAKGNPPQDAWLLRKL